MTERKALTRYYPLDYNPEEDRSQKRQRKHSESEADATNRMRIRMALPMHVVCDTCGSLIGEGRRFNAFKETLKERNYLGLKIYRFIVKCPGCSANFTLLTSPETSGYKCEHLCHAIGQHDGAQQAAERPDDNGGDDDDDETTVQKLERKAQENRAEMDMIEAIEKMKDLNQKHLRLRSEGGAHQPPKAAAAPAAPLAQPPKPRALQLFDLPQFDEPDPHTCVLSPPTTLAPLHHSGKHAGVFVLQFNFL